jgi:hypothetical protein
MCECVRKSVAHWLDKVNFIRLTEKRLLHALHLRTHLPLSDLHVAFAGTGTRPKCSDENSEIWINTYKNG